MKLLDYLEKFFAWLRFDGLEHLIVCLVLVQTFLPLLPPNRWWIAPAIVVVFMIAKEWKDSKDPKHACEWHDIWAGLIGDALGVFLYFWPFFNIW